jgi:integrase
MAVAHDDPPCRSGTTRWADIDFDKRIWTIPPERMKKRRPHSIPLTDQALALLETLKPTAATGIRVPGR